MARVAVGYVLLSCCFACTQAFLAPKLPTLTLRQINAESFALQAPCTMYRTRSDLKQQWRMVDFQRERANDGSRRAILAKVLRFNLGAASFGVVSGLAKEAVAGEEDSWALLRGGASGPSSTFKKPPPKPQEDDPWVDDEEDDGKTTMKRSSDDANEDDPWDDEEKPKYENPNIPKAPEEKSGLVVLRVAEVANFQEKILRAVASGQLDVPIAPNQISFGIEILLKNSNLDGNMKLMISEEIPEDKRPAASRNAARALNGLQTILVTAKNIERPFTNDDMVQIADLYNFVSFQLDEMYQLLPPDEKKKYYGYFRAVQDYEKKVAEGTYNPDIDGILEFK